MNIAHKRWRKQQVQSRMTIQRNLHHWVHKTQDEDKQKTKKHNAEN